MTRFAIVFAALTLITLAAHAQDDREQARAQFERGVGLYEAQDYAGALAAFQEAYRIAPHPTVRVNMANCYEHLNRPIEAIHHFERFLAESPAAPRPQRRVVEGAGAALRCTIGEIPLSVSPGRARNTLDGTVRVFGPARHGPGQTRGSAAVQAAPPGRHHHPDNPVRP